MELLYESPIARLIHNGRARPGLIYSNEYSLEEAPLAYRRFEQREESRVMLKGDRKEADGKDLEVRRVKWFRWGFEWGSRRMWVWWLWVDWVVELQALEIFESEE